jgi:hypothetical protein
MGNRLGKSWLVLVLIYNTIREKLELKRDGYMKCRKVIILFWTFIFSILLSSCDYGYNLYHTNTRDGAEVVNIELIYYDKNDNDNELNNGEFVLENLEVIESLSDNDIDIFLEQLSEIGGITSRKKQVMDFPNGTGIRITYEDNGFTLITVNNNADTIFVGDYDLNSNVEAYYGISWKEMINDFNSLISIYFDVNLD